MNITKKKVTALVMFFTIITLLSSPIIYPQDRDITTIEPTVRLSIASWPFPGEYGQGIKVITLVWTNGTTYDYCGWFHPYTTFREFEYGGEWFYNTSLVLGVGLFLNNTIVEADDIEDSLNYIRLNLTVSLSLTGDTVFSQNNLTIDTYLDNADPYFYYVYNATLNCFNTQGAVYDCYLTYEVYYEV